MLRKINLQLFAGEDDAPTLEGLLGMLGGSQTETPPVENPPAENPPSDPGTPPAENPPNQNPPNEPVESTDPNVQVESVDDKGAKAFAQMRIQNKQLADTVKGIAAMLKLDTSDPEAMNEKLREMILEKEAKDKGTDPTLYKRLVQLEEKDAAYQQQQLQQNAILGFQQVKTTFNLDNTALDTFATQLRQQGINPFENPVDLVSQYRLLNFDSIVQARIDAAVRAEQERIAKASNQSSTPNVQQGAGEGAQEKIDTVSQLTSFFDNALKGR